MRTGEVESARVLDDLVAEAAVVGCPHDSKGQGIYAYVTLNAGVEPTDEVAAALKQQVRTEIGPIATPDHIHLTPALPKTRSGKIMRRSEEHTSELQSLMRISYAVFCLKKKTHINTFDQQSSRRPPDTCNQPITKQITIANVRSTKKNKNTKSSDHH